MHIRHPDAGHTKAATKIMDKKKPTIPNQEKTFNFYLIFHVII